VLCTTAVKESEKRRRPGRGHRVMAKQQDKLLSLALLLAELIIYNYLSAALSFLDFNYSGYCYKLLVCNVLFYNFNIVQTPLHIVQ